MNLSIYRIVIAYMSFTLEDIVNGYTYYRNNGIVDEP